MTDFDFAVAQWYLTMIGTGIVTGLIYLMLFRMFNFKH